VCSSDLETLTIGTVARIDSPDEAQLRGIELDVERGIDGLVRVDMDDLRDALVKAGKDPARYAFSGSECLLRFRNVKPIVRESSSKQVGQVVALWEPPTSETSFYQQMLHWIAGYYDVPVEDMRIEWAEQDHAFLEREDPSVRLVIEMLSTNHAARAAIAVRLWRGEAIVASETVRADVQIFRRTVVTTRDIDRGEVIFASDLRERRAFDRPDGARAPTRIEDVAGMIAKKRLVSGTVVIEHHLKPAVYVKRGDIVTLYCLRGGIEIRTTMRAKEDGVMGQTIEIQRPGSRESVFARVDAPGRVIIGGRSNETTKGSFR